MLAIEENAMAGSGFDAEKDRLIDAITDAYSQGSMEMSSFERAVTRITASPDSASLAVEASALGLALSLPERDFGEGPGARAMDMPESLDLVEITCVSGRLRQEGEWVKAGRYRLFLKSSSARLDLREYEGRRGFRLLIELEAVSSSLRIDVPEGFEVEDRIAERQSSTLRNKPKSSIYDDAVVVLSGSIRSSTIRVKYR
jgi:hypothetical protein